MIRAPRLTKAVVVSFALVTACGDDTVVPPESEHGTIEVYSAPSGAQVYLDGSDRDVQTPDTISPVDVGEHVVKLIHDGYFVWIDTVEVFADSTTVVEADLTASTGRICVHSIPPGASIWLDNDSTGLVTPDTLADLSPESYHITLKLSGYDDDERTVYVDAGETETFTATLQAKCPGSIVGDPELDPEITFVGLEEGDRLVRGIADNVDAAEVRVVLWAKTDIWYVQPYIAWPYTDICGDGTWQNSTHPWIRLVALLVDSTYSPGATRRYHPASDPGVLAWTEYPAMSTDRYIDFSGYRWRVKRGEQLGPGPNYFSDRSTSVWLDSSGLHLATEFFDERWWCAEVVLDRSLGYGVYTFQVVSPINALNYNVVFAGFVYESGTREIDIEFSRVLADPHNAQYVIQPYYNPGNIVRFDMPAVSVSTHRFEWRSDEIVFSSWRGSQTEPSPDSLLASWTYTGADIPPPGEERMRFNLWLFGGNPPTAGQRDEVTVSSFIHKP